MTRFAFWDRFAGRFDSSALFIVLIMVKYNCCVPNCSNSWRNSPGLKFHTIPKDKEVRKEYKRLIRNVNLKEDSTRTRICGAHFPKGERMSRNQLPTIFPWKLLFIVHSILGNSISLLFHLSPPNFYCICSTSFSIWGHHLAFDTMHSIDLLRIQS